MLKSRAFWIVLLLLIAAPLLYFWAMWHWSYSSGERAGWVQKLSHKGWLCKTWEGELALVSMPGAASEKFLFTVHDEATAGTELEQLHVGDRHHACGARLAVEERLLAEHRALGDRRDHALAAAHFERAARHDVERLRGVALAHYGLARPVAALAGAGGKALPVGAARAREKERLVLRLRGGRLAGLLVIEIAREVDHGQKLHWPAGMRQRQRGMTNVRAAC